MIQPIVSSRIAEATMIWPRSRRMKFISRTTIATIFTEEIDSAVPRKIAVTRRASGFGSSASGSISPSAKPQMNGSADAGGGDRHGGAADPLHQLQIGFHAGQQQQHQNAELRHRIDHALLLGACPGTARAARAARSGRAPTARAKAPPMSCPITAGWPIRCAASPISRPTSSRSPSSAMKIASELTEAAPSAANAAVGRMTMIAASKNPAARSDRRCAGLFARTDRWLAVIP